MNRFRPVVSRRVPSGTHFAELYLTPGPQEIGVTGDNSYEALYGSEWLFMIEDDTRLLRAYQNVDSVWVERTTDPRMPPIVGQEMDASVRRLSGTFDQSARAVIAYEVGEGVVTGTRWDPQENQYKQNIDFAGTDPQTIIDAWWSGDIPSSDVLVFYLSPDRTRVCCRVQRDLYAVEHELWTFAAPVILDRVVAAPIRYQVLLSDASGVPLQEVLVSDPYPYWALEMLAAGAAGPTAGDYAQVVIPIDLTESLSVAALGPSSGAYADPLIEYALTGEALSVTATGPNDGAYAEAILEHMLAERLGVNAAGPSSGAYTNVVIETSLDGETLSVAASGPTGGTYA